jgi:hypothetical protein
MGINSRSSNSLCDVLVLVVMKSSDSELLIESAPNLGFFIKKRLKIGRKNEGIPISEAGITG